MSIPNFPAKIYIDTIRQALWRGHAAVMIGSGFSRNAKKANPVAPSFPLWDDVAKHICLALGKPAPRFGDDPMRLADEYEHTFCRADLDGLLLQLIPDAQYEPSSLYKDLVSLPWTDIFTTNYDTLLERTRASLPGMDYNLVLTSADIPRSVKPRIVKLHGSFPSQRPFILTTEDYRRYPVTHAAFVNMVQQSVMENSFCLMGFSGTDPNFLQWVGWVRDHLQGAAPKIYLCGIHDLNPSKEHFYQSLRVIPVDLAPLFPKEKWPIHTRHTVALEWLIRSLHNGEPIKLENWPNAPEAKPLPPLSFSEPPPMPPINVPIIIKNSISSIGDKIENLRSTIDAWRSERIAYPKWVICPEENRNLISNATVEVLFIRDSEQLKNAIQNLNISDRFKAMFEITWRLRTALLPLPDWFAGLLTGQLESINPWPTLIRLVCAQTDPQTSPDLDWDSLTDNWAELGFAVINDCWQTQDVQKFELWTDRIGTICHFNSEWQARWCAERCWFHYLRLNEQGVREALNKWPQDHSLPYWEAKRAAFWAAIGERKTAKEIVESSLTTVQQSLSKNSAGYGLLSAEGWLLELLLSITSYGDQAPISYWKARLRELHRDRCDPASDLDLRTRAARALDPNEKMSRRLGFDPDALTISINMKTWAGFEWAWLQSLHDAPLPLRSDEKTLAAITPWLFGSHAKLILTLIPHMDSKDILDKVLNRANIAQMDQVLVCDTYQWLAERMKVILRSKEDSRVPQSRLYRSILNVCPQIISRLTIRLPNELLHDAFDLAVSVYESKLYTADVFLHGRVAELFKRVIFAANDSQIIKWLPRLLSLSIPGYAGFEVISPSNWEDPFNAVRWDENPPKVLEAIANPCHQAIDKLLYLAEHSDKSVRERALSRLAHASLMNALDSAQVLKFRDVLWKKADKYGLPSDTGLIPTTFLFLPAAGRQSEILVSTKQFLLDEPVPGVLEKYGDATAANPARAMGHLNMIWGVSTKAWLSQTENSCRIDWSIDETKKIYNNLYTWWQAIPSETTGAKNASDSLLIPTDHLINEIAQLLADVIVPRLAKADDAASEKAQVLEMAKAIHAIDPSRVEISVSLLLLDFSPEKVEACGREIRRLLHGPVEADVKHAGDAIFIWLASNAGYGLTELPSVLLNELASLILSRRMPGLRIAIEQMVQIIKRFPSKLNNSEVEGLLLALEYLETETGTAGYSGSNDALNLDPQERVQLRAKASELAAMLLAYFENQGQTVPEILKKWRKVGLDSYSLPEWRHPWIGQRT